MRLIPNIIPMGRSAGTHQSSAAYTSIFMTNGRLSKPSRIDAPFSSPNFPATPSIGVPSSTPAQSVLQYISPTGTEWETPAGLVTPMPLGRKKERRQFEVTSTFLRGLSTEWRSGPQSKKGYEGRKSRSSLENRSKFKEPTNIWVWERMDFINPKAVEEPLYLFPT